MTHTQIGKQAQGATPLWRVGILPGGMVIALVMLLRLSGALQWLEWWAFDTFLRWRSPQAIDERIVIIGIDEQDIQTLGTYPVPDGELARLIEILQRYEPRVIGLDLVRDIPVEPGHAELVKIFQESPQLVGVEKVLLPPIAPPASLPAPQVGFADVLIDPDGKTRRALLGMGRPEAPQTYVFSFPLLLAQAYLDAEGLSLENGRRDPQAMRWGATELPRFQANAGGYRQGEDFGVQLLLNFRPGPVPFRVLSLADVTQGNFQPAWIRDRLILIGMSAPSIKDFINTGAIAQTPLPGKIYGVQFHAHVASYLIGAVKGERALINTWTEAGELIWMVGWGILGIVLGSWRRSPIWQVVWVGVGSLGLVGIGYLALLAGWWIPVIPALMVFVVNGVVLAAFWQYARGLQAQIEERQNTIEQTFAVIHNGPLQTLANLLRQVGDRPVPPAQLLAELEHLNQEIREVGEYLHREALLPSEGFRLGNGVSLDLKYPLHELFYEVYHHTLTRDFPYFQTLKVKVRSFDPVPSQGLSLQHKRQLCQFLEEALCNVGKHAQGVTRLSAIGTQRAGQYILRVEDNGNGQTPSDEGRGTRQFRHLARRLGGNFRRESLSPRGNLCELIWTSERNLWRQFSFQPTFRR